MTQLISIKEYTYKDITVKVKIDYINNQISLVESAGLKGNYQNKSWIFANRGVEYMNGWLIILDAMKFAICEAKKDYEKELAEQSKFTEKVLEEIVKKKKL